MHLISIPFTVLFHYTTAAPMDNPVYGSEGKNGTWIKVWVTSNKCFISIVLKFVSLYFSCECCLLLREQWTLWRTTWFPRQWKLYICGDKAVQSHWRWSLRDSKNLFPIRKMKTSQTSFQYTFCKVWCLTVKVWFFKFMNVRILSLYSYKV